MSDFKIQYKIHFIPKSKEDMVAIQGTKFKEDVTILMNLMSNLVQDRLQHKQVRTKLTECMRNMLWLMGGHEVTIEDRTSDESIQKGDIPLVWSYDKVLSNDNVNLFNNVIIN
jgi:hypothetical protein